MRISYNKLWKMLIDKNMKKKRPERTGRNQFCLHCQTWQRG